MIETVTGLRERVLIADDEAVIREMISEKLQELGYRCATAEDGMEALIKIQEEDFALAILDIKMPKRHGLELLSEIKAISKDTEVIIISTLHEIDYSLKAHDLGAIDYVTKPFNIERFRISVEKALEKRRLTLENRDYQLNLEKKVEEQTRALREAFKKIEANYEITLEALVAALDAREHETHNHSKRVMAYTLALGRKFGLDDASLRDIGRGALLHDIGKIGVPDAILLKQDRLTAEEWVEMRKHPEIGYNMIKGIGFLEKAAEIVLSHQENYNGSGYPRGLKGNDICLGARIFSVVDTFDAMTSDRPYRSATDFEKAQEEIDRYSGQQFDPELVKTFLSISKEEWVAIKAKFGGHFI
jgi:putative nucleotidyltransferase with HDIG domain